MNKLDFINHFIKKQHMQKPNKRMSNYSVAPPASDLYAIDHSEDKNTIMDFLSQILLLKGIPVNYIIPHPDLLPDESIRFFSMDMEWINHLIMGALSLGSKTEFDTAIDNMTEEIFKWGAYNEAYSHILDSLEHLKAHLPESELNKLSSIPVSTDSGEDFIYSKEISGFLMKSEFVDRWQGVKIKAFVGDHEARVLNSVIIGTDIKLCLFEGQCDKYEFYENTGSLSLGFDTDDKKLFKNLRSNPHISDSESVSENRIEIKFRNESEEGLQNDGVLDIRALSLQIASNVGQKRPLNSAEFTYYLLQGADNFQFSLTQNGNSK